MILFCSTHGGYPATISEDCEVVRLERAEPDYEAAWVAYEDQYQDMECDGLNLQAIVDAAFPGPVWVEADPKEDTDE